MEMHQGLSTASSDDDRCKLQLSAYAKVDARDPERHSGCTPVMVSITTPSGMASHRVPVDVVLVLHVHINSMAPANWHFLLNQATEMIVRKLGNNDRLAIVPALLKERKTVTKRITRFRVIRHEFDVAVEPKLSLMSSENKLVASQSVESSEAMRNHNPLLSHLTVAESILYDRESDEKEKRAGHIIVISNRDEDISSILPWRFRFVHVFGFRDSQDARTMYTIAIGRENSYGTLDDGGRITQAFAACVDKVTSTAVPIEVRLKCNRDVILSTIEAPRISSFISHNKKVGIIWANATHHAGVATNFIVYLSIPRDYYGWEYGSLLTVEVKYGHPPYSSQLKKQPLVAVLNGFSGSKEVAAEMVRMEAVKIVADITLEDKSDCQKLLEAADVLRERWSRLAELREMADAGLISRLTAQIQELDIRLHNNYWGPGYMLSWQSNRWWPPTPLIMDKEQQATTSDPLLQLRIVLANVGALPEPIRKTLRGLPVLLQVVVPMEVLAKEKRGPLDLVAVLDVSSYWMKERLKLLNEAMKLVAEKLSHTDRLAVIHVQAAVTEPADRLREMTKEGRSHLTKMLSVVTSASKATQKVSPWRKHLNKLGRKSPGTDVLGRNKLYSSLMDASKLLDDRGADDKDRTGLIIVISDSGDTSICQITLSFSYTVHAFSFSGADNARAMHHIASSSSGTYAIIDDHRDNITNTFIERISKITSIIAVNTKVNIQCSYSSQVTLSSIESGQFKSSIDHGRKSGSIFAGALYGGAVRRFVAYLKNVRDDDYGELSKMLAVDVTWQHASSRVEGKIDGEVAIVADENDESTEVGAEIVRMEEVKIISAIADPKTESINYDTVLGKVQKLHEDVRLLDDDVRVQPRGYNYASTIHGDILENIKSDKDVSSLSYVLSWLSLQGLCEKPPSAPSRPRQERGDNLPLEPIMSLRRPCYIPRQNRLP